MIGRALEGDVERDLDAELAGACEQPAEVLERAEARMHGLVSAFAAADRPGTSGIVRRGAGAVVGALALDFADRMDRRQIEDIEAHRGDIGEESLDVRQRAVLAGPSGGGARKHLVPGREARALAVDLDGERRVVTLDELRVGAAPRELAQRLALRQQGPLLAGAHRIGERLGPLPQPARLRVGQPARVRQGQRRALSQVDVDVLPRLVFLRKSPSPALEVIDPCLDGEEISAERLDRKAPLPAIVAEEAHRHSVPL